MSKMVSFEQLKQYDKELKGMLGFVQRNTEYAVNDIVKAGRKVLKCITAGTTDTAKLILKGKTVGTLVTDGTVVWKIINLVSDEDIIANKWATNVKYKENRIINFGNDLYFCLVEHTSNVFATDYNDGKWIKINQTTSSYTKGKLYVKDSTMIFEGREYRCLKTHTATTDVPWGKVNGIYEDYSYATTPICYKASTTSGDAYGAVKSKIYDFGDIVTPKKITVSFDYNHNPNPIQVRAFNILYSVDGTNYTSVYSASNDSGVSGATVELADVTARYIKVECCGRTSFTGQSAVNAWLSHIDVLISNADKWEYIGGGIYLWETDRKFEANTLAWYNDKLYFCKTTHISGTFATDLKAGKWLAVAGSSEEELATEQEIKDMWL